jgi:hypothetical protein
VTGNTVSGDCADLISLASGSTGAVVENNILTTLVQGQDVCPAPAPGAAQIDVSSDSTAKSVIDYNIVHPYGAVAPYAWAGTTYVATWSGVVYVAFAVDTFSRRIVGWSASTNKRTPLILSALERQSARCLAGCTFSRVGMVQRPHV